jgi:hypothetical protein
LNWRDYEVLITRHFQRLFPDASIKHDVKRPGLISRVDRQIDMLIEGRVSGFDLTIIVDCKYFGKKVDVKDVDEFLGYLHDLRASKGVLITNNGFTEAASNRARFDTRDVELRIISTSDLEAFQSFLAVIYFGPNGAVISAPDGWLIDASPPNPQLAALYPLGLKRDEAFHKEGYIYVSYSRKDASWPSLDHLLQTQEEGIRRHYSLPRVDYETRVLWDERIARVRHLEASELPDTCESTLFLDFDDHIIYLNLLAPRAKHEIYLGNLFWVAEKLIPLKIVYGPDSLPIAAPRSDA